MTYHPVGQRRNTQGDEEVSLSHKRTKCVEKFVCVFVVKMKMMFAYLRWDHIISHVPELGVHVRCVGESKSFHFGGDGADDRVCLLVGLLHHTHIPAGLQRYDTLTMQLNHYLYI